MNHSSVIRVASVPHGHVYVQHLADPDRDDGVIRLPDPPPENPAVGAPWWPLVMLDAHWITDHADEFDLYHLHFGFDSVAPEELAHITQTLRNLGKPFVYTVHDLRNPHHLDRAAHDAALDVLVPAADALITLTQGAAQEISSRWDREAAVIPHPHVVDLPTMRRERPHRERATVGIHLKSLRASIDPLPVLAALLAELQERDFELVVDVHTDVVTPGEYNHDPDVTAFLSSIEQIPGVRVHVHDFYPDEELWDYFLGLDLSVLPYRFGTHSGWLEACFDLGTRVLAPRLGHYHSQQEGVLGYGRDEDGRPNRTDIAAALDLVQDPAWRAVPWRADPEQRLAQRRAIAAVHRRVYEQALDEIRA